MKRPCARCLRWIGCVLYTLALTASAMAQQPITFQYFYDELGQLIKVVDSTGIVIEYVYDAVGNILEIKRSTVTGLALFDFTPKQGPVGTTVTIQGQSFSAIPADNLVRFNGVLGSVTTATATTLVVTVPPGASTGLVAVQVGAATATTSTPFTVTSAPTITSVRPVSAFAGTTIATFQVTGTNLTGSTFTFLPAFVPPAVTINTVSIASSGTSATLGITLGAGAIGQFVVVATNADGSSDPFVSAQNSFVVIDPNRQDVDSDGDKFPDSLEVLLGSSPADPQSVPTILVPPLSLALGHPFSLLNTVNPSPGPPPPLTSAQSAPFSLLNTVNPAPLQVPVVTEALGPVFSIHNLGMP